MKFTISKLKEIEELITCEVVSSAKLDALLFARISISREGFLRTTSDDGMLNLRAEFTSRKNKICNGSDNGFQEAGTELFIYTAVTII